MWKIGQLSLWAKGKANMPIFDQMHMVSFSTLLHMQNWVFFKLHLCGGFCMHHASFLIYETTTWCGVSSELLITSAIFDTETKCYAFESMV